MDLKLIAAMYDFAVECLYRFIDRCAINMFKCVSGGSQASDNPWPIRNCSNAWIPTLYASLVFADIDALNKRSISLERARSGIAPEWAEVVRLLQVPGSLFAGNRVSYLIKFAWDVVGFKLNIVL